MEPIYLDVDVECDVCGHPIGPAETAIVVNDMLVCSPVCDMLAKGELNENAV